MHAGRFSEPGLDEVEEHQAAHGDGHHRHLASSSMVDLGFQYVSKAPAAHERHLQKSEDPLEGSPYT